MSHPMDLRTPHGPALLEWLDQIERDIPQGWCVTLSDLREARVRAKALIADHDKAMKWLRWRYPSVSVVSDLPDHPDEAGVAFVQAEHERTKDDH